MTWHHFYPAIGTSEKLDPRVYLCKTCHSVVHECHSNKELRDKYNNLEDLIKSAKIKNMVNLYKYKAHDCVFTVRRLRKLCQMNKNQ